MRPSLRRLGWAFLLLTGLILVSGASRADRDRSRLDRRLTDLWTEFEDFQALADRRVPPEILQEARGIVVLRETKAGLLIGTRTGSGVVLLKDGETWSAPAFIRTRQGSVGLQAGWQDALLIQVLMTPHAVDAFRTNQFRLGVDLRITAGPRTVGDEAKMRSGGSDILLYTDTDGVFGGLSLEGGAMEIDDRANRTYYGMDAWEVLSSREQTLPDAARRLVAALAAATDMPGSAEDRAKPSP